MMRRILLFLFLTASLWAQAQDRASQIREKLLSDNNYVLVVAHRGDWRNFPENSLNAFRSCIEKQVDVIELDVQRTLDGVLVLMHDGTVDRTTNGKGQISEMTYAEIQELGLLSMHEAWVTRNKVPTLEEALNLCKGKILINVDKGYDYFDEVFALLQKTGTTDQVIIKSRATLEHLQKEHPEVLGHTIYMPVVNIDRDDAEEFIDAYFAAPLVAIEVDFNTFNENAQRNLQKIKDHGLKVWFNALWPSQNAGHDDDRAVELQEPDEAWGWLLEQGAKLIQTDRISELQTYLRARGRRK